MGSLDTATDSKSNGYLNDRNGSSDNDEKDWNQRLQLQHVIVMHRHGDRSPVYHECGKNLYVSEEDKEFWKGQLATPTQVEELNRVGKVVGETKYDLPARDPQHGGMWPCGHLTQRGIAQMNRVGQQLREKYADYIDPMWTNDQVYVQSTNYFRTLQSVQSLLSGLFDAKSYPFFIHTHAKDILGPHHPMDIYDTLEKDLADKIVKAFDAHETEALRQRVRSVLGIEPDAVIPWTAARDILTCNRVHNVPYSDAINEELVKRITHMDTWLWYTLYERVDFCRQAYQSGVEEIFSHLERAAKGEHSHKLVIFSAHDSSIVAFLQAMQIETPEDLPPYGSTLCMETYKDPVTNATYLKIDLNNQTLCFKQNQTQNGYEKYHHQRDSSEAMTPFDQVQAAAQAFLQN